MPRHPLKPELVEEIRRHAGLGSDFTTEISYQTETKLVWIVLSKGDKTLEHSVTPVVKSLVRQIGEILRAGKNKINEDRKLSDYVDTSKVLPDKSSQEK